MDIHKNEVFRSRFKPLLYLLPTILVLIVFIYYPAFKTLILAFYRSNFFIGTKKFIGLENFKNLFTGVFAPGFYQVFIQTFIFSFLVVVLGLGLSLFLAILANKDIKGAKIYRLLLIWPFALSPAVSGTIFSFMFNPEVGIVNTVLNKLFAIRPGWVTDPYLAFALIVIATIWKNLGYNIVFYLAALQSINKAPLESAIVDGANGWKRFRYILFPLLSPITFFLAFTNITYSFFDSFGLIDVLTKGGPVGPSPLLDNEGVTTTLMYKVFLDGFGGSANMGFASATTILLMFMVAVFTIVQFGYLGRKVNYDN